jgi:hypothetical protein
MSGIKRTVALASLLGLSTLFLPMFSVAPPALGKTEWSAWDIMMLLASGPNPAEWFFRVDIFRLWITYALLACGLLLLWLPQYYKPFALCTVVGLWSIGRALQHLHFEYSRMFEIKTVGWYWRDFDYKSHRIRSSGSSRVSSSRSVY